MEEPSRPFQIPYRRHKDPLPVASDLASMLHPSDHLPVPSGDPISLPVELPRPSASLRGAMLATKQRVMAIQVDRNALQRDCKAPPAHERIPWKKKLAKGAASLAVASVLAATPWEADASVNLLKPEDVALYQEKIQGNPTRLYPDEQETIRIFNDATTSVVFITNLSSRRDYFTLDVTEVPQGSGSGFVWDSQGHVVTNFHVVKGASDLRVTLGSQSTYPAKVVGFDEDKDIAVVEIKAKPEEKLKPIPLGSSDKLLVGQTVYAIGNPFGLDHTLTRGVISGLQREIVSGNTGRPIRGIIQTDASINPGNSGGPLLDSNGNLIGMNTAILSPSGSSAGVGFAIPVDTINTTVNQLLKYGRIVRPQLGIAIAPDQTVRRVGKRGVLVLQVPPGSPAAAAGLQPTRRNSYGEIVFGDIITEVQGRRVEGMNDLYRVLDECKVGQEINLKVFRDGEGEVTVPITLGAYVRQFD